MCSNKITEQKDSDFSTVPKYTFTYDPATCHTPLQMQSADVLYSAAGKSLLHSSLHLFSFVDLFPIISVNTRPEDMEGNRPGSA